MDISRNAHCRVRKSQNEEYSKKKVIIIFHDVDTIPTEEELELAVREDAANMLQAMGYTDYVIDQISDKPESPCSGN